MAIWRTPKTDWVRTDGFNVLTDYVRIRDNLLFLRETAARLYPVFTLPQLREYGITDIPVASFFNDVEDGLKALYTHTLARDSYRTKTFKAGDRVWDYGDLNRIERMELQLYQDLAAHQRRTIKFRMGGGQFGTAISGHGGR